ncbi:MAG TPA: sugar ABC transporter ATP-binding protein [Phycisphaerae bacterium]|nr:sugar ABC transporter ATP-binding protein [Phycisphaerae bacterium]
MEAAGPRLCCRGIRKAFPGVLALDDVGLEVAPGTVHALVGENGAGKSTLVKILSGAVTSDAGTIEIDGRPVSITGARRAQQEGIAIVYQEFSLAPDLCVSENIYLGRWPRSRRTGCIDFNRLHRQASQLLAQLGIELPVRRSVGALSVAQQQMVEIARALALDARILILDEPSAVLTPHELVALYRLVCDLKTRGVSVIYISHRLDEIFDIADAVTVLRDGRHISTRPIAQVERRSLIAEMVGRELTDEFPKRSAPIGEAILRVENLTARGRFTRVSFDVRAGEVFALTGLVGSGRSSVAKTIFGAVRADAGRVQVGDVAGPFANPRQAIAAGVAMLPEDRKTEGLMLERSLRENVTLANLRASAVGGFLRMGAERALSRRLMADLQIRAVSSESLVVTLSGGNQQKVLLARWMSRPHRVILFDEPTRGVDVGAKYEIYLLINRLAAGGVAVMMVSSELPEVIGMADRVGVMCEGRLAGVLDNRDRQVTQEQIMHLAAREEVTA